MSMARSNMLDAFREYARTRGEFLTWVGITTSRR
jgi:hypothetical protein